MDQKRSFYIDGKKVFLREVRQSDVKQYYYQWMNDPEINQYLETRFVPQSLDNIVRFVESKDGDQNEIFLAICWKENEQHIGNIKLGPINWVHRFGEISLFVGDKNYWGKNIATEAIQLMTDYAFNTLNLHRVSAGCYSNNKGSAKAFQKAGFCIEGSCKEHFFSQGRYVDKILLGKVNYS